MTERLQWAIQEQNGVSLVKLKGSIDEDADFVALGKDIPKSGRLRLDLSEISRINSCGVREWVNFIRSLPQTSQIELENCNPIVVSQINMISNFTGPSKILSVRAPYVCDACGHEMDVPLNVETGKPPTLSEVKCPKCSGIMEFDDIEDSFFAFLV